MDDLRECFKKRRYKKDGTTNTSPIKLNKHSEEQKTPKRHQPSFSAREKLTILQKLDSEPLPIILQEYNVHERTIRRWKKDRKSIEDVCNKEVKAEKKKNRGPKNPELEDALYIWFLNARTCGIPISGTILKNLALQINEELGGDKFFTASDGWLENWKHRKSIKSLKISGEKLSANFEAGNKYIYHLHNIVTSKGLTRSQIFNFDETSFTIKSLPTNTLTSKDHSEAAGYKSNKERVTLAACCNADGSCKLPLLIIGKAAKPRCFKNISIKNLPVTYKSQKNAWMTALIFKEWFKDVFVPHVLSFLQKTGLPPKAVLIVDNCKSHVFEKVGDIEISFLPPNVTSIIQPLDQGILESLKRRYKCHFLQQVVNVHRMHQMNPVEFLKTIDLLQVIQWIDNIWSTISSRTIYKCWNKIWFIEKKDMSTQTDENPSVLTLLDSVAAEDNNLSEEENIMMRNAILSLQTIDGYKEFNQLIFDDWMNEDKYMVFPELTPKEVIEQLGNFREESLSLLENNSIPENLTSSILPEFFTIEKHTSSLISESLNLLI